MLRFCVSQTMDLLSPPCNNITIIISTLACTFVLLFFLCKLSHAIMNKRNNGRNGKLAVPEASGGRPIIGHLHLLLMAGGKPLHLILASLADKYGPIFRIRLGAQETIVVSNSRIAKECFTTNDKLLATRPKALASEIMGYNYNIFAIAPYGAYWRQIRKTVVLELLSSRRIELLRSKRESHVRKSIKSTYEYWSKNKDPATGAVTMEMKQMFDRVVTNMLVSMLFGEEEVEEESKLDKSIHRLFELFGVPVVADFIPWLRWLDIGGHERAMRQTALEMDNFVNKWMEGHRRKRIFKSKEEEEEDDDFMDTMLSLFDGVSNQSLPDGYDNDCVIKSTCLTILLAATDTTSITLAWALSLVLNNYKVMERIQDELDTHIEKERFVEESDVKQLIYLQAVIKETLRLFPPAPLAVPHEAIEDCTINGYYIKKGSRILPNFTKIHRDPMVWANPNEFIPERFLTDHKDVDVRGNNFELIQFGSGRRICPGISFGLQIVQLTLASQIHSFEMKRLSNEPIDLTESYGLTNCKATPLQALLVPRLASNLYG